MAFKPCTACHEKFNGKATSIYFSWMEDSRRIAYIARLCLDCTFDWAAPWIKRAIARHDEVSCDQCGASGPDDYQPVWTTVYRPKAEMEQFELVFCDECVEMTRAKVSDGARLAPDLNGVSSRGPVNNADEDVRTPW